MKIHLILFCLMIGCTAHGFIQQGFDYDKPTSVYVDNDTQKLDDQTHERFDSWWDEQKTQPKAWFESWNTTHYDHSWGDPGNDLGLGSGSSLSDGIYNSSSYSNTDVCQEEMSWEGTSATGDLSGDCAPDPNVPQPILGPVVGSEHCEVNDPVPAATSFGYAEHTIGSDWEQMEYDETYTRHAQTKYKLRVGGKGVPGSQTLHELSGWAKDFTKGLGPNYKRDVPPYPFTINSGGYGGSETVYGLLPFVPSQNVSIGSLGNLGSDGVLYKVLPSGAPDVDVTPKISGSDFYIFAVGDNEFDPYITANGVKLDPETVVDGAQFCVGQYIQFSPSSLPGQPGPVQWVLDGTFVNTNIPPQYSDGCPDYYVENAAYLQSETTHAWWTSGGYPYATYEARVGEGLTFPNGQYVTITAKGLFSMHRPRLVNYSPSSIGMALLHWHSYGDPPFPANPFMDTLIVYPSANYSLYVDSISPFNGEVMPTQILNGAATNSVGGIDTEGMEYLDNVENYYDGVYAPVIAGNISQSKVPFADQPNIDCIGNTVQDLQFKDYIRFEPFVGPGPNIFVTLGTVSWYCNASTSLATVPGTTNQDYTPFIPPGIDPPDYVPTGTKGLDSPTTDNSFPNWVHTAHNIGGN